MTSAIRPGQAALCLAIALGALIPSAAPAVPARPARILVTAAVEGDPQIYSVGASGALAQLTFSTAAPASSPVPSPDGRLVAFTRKDELWVMRPDGREQRRLATRVAGTVTWTPDSRRVAFVAGQGIRAVPHDGGRSILLVRQGRLPAWSADGSTFAYVTTENSGERMHVRRGARRYDFASASGSAVRLSVSPDGTQLAVVGSGRIEIDRFDGKRLRVVAGFAAAWSPDGRRLAIKDIDGLALLIVDTGARRTLARPNSASRELAWSPDGRELAYYALGPGQGLRLMAVTPAGRVRQLGPPYGYDGESLTWSKVPVGLRFRPAVPLEVGSATELRLRVAVRELAVDGDRVAYRICQTIGVWRPGEARSFAVRPEPGFLCRESLLLFYGLTVAGDRVAWGAYDDGSIIERNWVSVSDVRVRDTESIVAANGGRLASRENARAGYVLGDGSLLAFSTWSYCDDSARDVCNPMPAEPRSQRLWRVRDASYASSCPLLVEGTWSTARTQLDGRCQLLRTEPGPLEPFDADGGRILAGGTNATLVLDGETGAVNLSIPTPVLAGQLSGRDLVLLRRAELRRYDATTGALVRTYPLADVPSGGPCGTPCYPPQLQLQDVAHGLVAYLLDGRLHVLRLSDGTDAIVAAGTAARFGDAGLFYAHEAPAPYRGRITLLPFGSLPG